MQRSQLEAENGCREALASSASGTEAGAGASPGGPGEWITPELIQITLKVWQPRYKAQLSEDDARTILLSVGRLFDTLALSRPRR